MTERRFGRRLGVTMLVALAAVTAFAVVGGTGLAGGLKNPFKAQYGPGGQYQGKVTICHKGWVTIRIAWAAWPAHHDRHGDTMGPCSPAAVKAGKSKAAKLKAAKLKAAKLKAAKLKAAKLKAAKQKAKQQGKATKAGKAAAKAKKKGTHATATGKQTSTADVSETSGHPHGPPPGHGNGQGKGHGKKG